MGCHWEVVVTQTSFALLAIQLARGTSVTYIVKLSSALFIGLLLYSLQALHGMSRANLKKLEGSQAQALRVCLGLHRAAMKHKLRQLVF